MADKKIIPGVINKGTHYGLIKNGKFKYNIDEWENRAGGKFEYSTDKHLNVNDYVTCFLTVPFIEAGTTIEITYVVEVIGANSGYTDIYEINSSNDSNNWQKVYFSEGTEIAPNTYKVSRQMTLSYDCYKLNFNFNHNYECKVHWVKCEIV